MLSKIQSDSAEKHNLLGLDELYIRKQYVKAIAHFTRALFANSKEPSYFWHRAEAYLAISDFESCILNLRLFQESIKSQFQKQDENKNVSIYVNLKRFGVILYTWAQILLDQKRFRESLLVFKQTLDFGFSFADIGPRLAIVCIGLNEIDEAISHLCQLTNTEKLINQDIEIYLLKARLYYIQGKPFLAAADLKIASQINPKHPALYSLTFKILEIANDIKNKASTEIIRNDLKAAISYLSQAIELDSEDYKILMLRGIVYGRLEKNQEGLDDLLEVYTWPNRNGDQEKELSIEIAKLHEKIAVFLFESQAKYEMALERFQLSFNFNPNNPKTFKSRADCYLKMGNRQDDAIRDLMAVYHFDPKKSTLNSTIEFKSLLSDVKEKLCSIYTKRAKTQIDKAMSLPLSSDTARHKEYSAAVSNLTTAMKYQADSSPSSLLLFERARCFFYMQNLESMKQDIEECLALHPNHALSLALLSLYDMMPYPSLPFPKREIPAINAISQITREKQQDLILSNDKEQSGKQVEKDGLMVKGKLEALKKGLLPEINIEKVDELFKKVGLV